MIEHFKIANHKIIQNTELEDLSDITVVCGPNNSGKSTLLQAITNSTYGIIGRAYSDDDAQNLYNATIKMTKWGDANALHRGGQERYLQFIKQALEQKKIWFRDETGEFEKTLERASRDDWWRRNTSAGLWHHLTRALEKIFSEIKTNSVIISPKRNIETKAAIQTSATVEPSGHGLLNFLFSSKNTPHGNRETHDRIVEAFTHISNGYQFGIHTSTEPGNEITLNFSRGQNVWRAADACGLGLQDLMVILYFALAPEYRVVCIEEPENHMHPDMQRRLLVFLKDITDRQFFITTHSNVFLNNTLVDRVLVTRYENDRIHVSDVTSRASLLHDLGYSVSDNLVSDLVILVEGPTDVPVLEELLHKKELTRDFEIKIWPLGGDIMDQLDLDVLAEGHRLVALLDKDPGSAKIRQRFARKCEELGIPVTHLKKYAIENYFSLSALREVFSTQIPIEVTRIDPNRKLETQIGLNVKNRTRNIVRAMSLEDIEGTDLEEFLNQVEKMCQDEK